MSLDPVNGGGSVERTLQMSRYLAKSGVECTVVTTNVGLTSGQLERLQGEGVDVVALPTILKRYYLPKVFYDRIDRIIENVDVIHLVNHWTLLNALVFHCARRLRKPYVVCPAGALPIFGRSKIVKGIYNHIIGKRIIRQADACVAISPLELADFKVFGVREDIISVIPNGIDPEEFEQKDDQGFRRKYELPDAPFILFMGRLNAIKGPDLLLEAFISVIRSVEGFPYHLVFAGPDGGMLHELQARSDREGVENRVHFLGYVGGVDKSHAYRAAGLLAIPSRQEAMSIVVLEAGISGAAVLITDRCGFDDVAAVAGGMVVAASVEGLKDGLIAMTADPGALKSMGRNLEKFTRDHYLWEDMVNRYLQLFSKIIRSGPA